MSATALTLRLNDDERNMAERAAAALGQPLDEFVAAAVRQETARVLSGLGRTCLTDRDRDIFVDLLESDREPNAALVAAAEQYKAYLASAHAGRLADRAVDADP